MVSTSTVLEKITDSFQEMAYPGDLNIVYDQTGYHLECVEIQQTFLGKHWSDLTLETLLLQDSALCFMTPEAFRFYLPAYLSIVIREFEETNVLLENTVSHLTLPVEADSLYKLNIIQQGTRDYLPGTNPLSDEEQDMINQVFIDQVSRSTQKVHNFIEQVSGFNQQQGQAIRYYLEYLSAEKENHFIDHEPEIAIARYWFIFPL